MKITCIASGSKGNAYLINDGVSTLLVECGVKLDMIKKATIINLADWLDVLSAMSTMIMPNVIRICCFEVSGYLHQKVL